MSLANKKFKNNFTGEIVRVIDSFEDIVILDNKTKTNTTSLMNPNLYSEISESVSNFNTANSEHIDVDNFFTNQKSYDLLANKIKSIPQEYIGNSDSNQVQVNFEGDGFTPPPMTENLIYETSERQEKEALAKKYNLMDFNSVKNQNLAFSKLLGDDEATIHEDYIDDIQRIEVVREENFENSESSEYTSKSSNVNIHTVDDPIIKMFKGVKRNIEFNMNIEFFDKIPRVDFIEMMEDSYETSIIDFLADEFTQKILNNPEKIKDSIRDKIKKIVYSSELQDVKSEVKAIPKLREAIVDDKVSSSDISEESEKKESVKTKRTYNRRKNQDTND